MCLCLRSRHVVCDVVVVIVVVGDDVFVVDGDSAPLSLEVKKQWRMGGSFMGHCAADVGDNVDEGCL